MLAALVAYLEAVIAGHQLRSEAAAAEDLAQAYELRTALLEAVSHDLRTPLASIRALTTGWLAPDVELDSAATHESMIAIDQSAQRLSKLVDNLLDMSRIQAGAVQPVTRLVGLDEVVPAAVASLSGDVGRVVVDVAEDLPPIEVDAALLERAVANLVENALRYSPADEPVVVSAGAVAGRVDLRVVDRGPGVPIAQRERMFVAFQRLGDSSHSNGVGLGLAVAQGFIEAIGGALAVEDTPGGGLTMVVELPVASGGQVVPPAPTTATA